MFSNDTTDFVACSVSKPEQLLYNATKVLRFTADTDIGPELIHVYEVGKAVPFTL